jgi:hypothetical protein
MCTAHEILDTARLAWYRGCMPLNPCYPWCWAIAWRDIAAGTAADLPAAARWASAHLAERTLAVADPFTATREAADRVRGILARSRVSDWAAFQATECYQADECQLDKDCPFLSGCERAERSV